jgi:hypothetical protein
VVDEDDFTHPRKLGQNQLHTSPNRRCTCLLDRKKPPARQAVMGSSENDRCKKGCRNQPQQISKTTQPKIDLPGLFLTLKDIYSDPLAAPFLGFKGGTAAVLFYGLDKQAKHWPPL